MNKTEKGRLADFRAVLITSIAPGYIGGGSQCALAFAQAISRMHNGKMSYVGPAFLKETDPETVEMQDYRIVERRSTIEKLLGALTGSHVDRVTAPARAYLSEQVEPEKTVVYVSGESAGRVVSIAKSLGFHTVFCPQNFAPDYLKAESVNRNLSRWWYNRVIVSCSLAGYRDAGYRLLLTEEDKVSYEQRVGVSGNAQGEMYFGYEGLPLTPRQARDSHHPCTVLINTNMALQQNEHGIEIFLRDIWPTLAEENFQLILAGRHPTDKIKRLAGTAIRTRLVARPSPEEMEAIFSEADVCVAATVRGSGIKLRVAEGLRRGLPVVSTPHCGTGYSQISSDVLRIFSTADQAIQHLRSLASANRAALQEMCYAEYEKHLSFSAGLRKFETLQARLTGGSAH